MMRGAGVFFLFLTFCFHLQAYAEADGPDFWELKGDEARHLYAEQTPDSPVIDIIPGAAKGLRNLGCKGYTPFDTWNTMTPEEKVAAKDRIWCKVGFKDQIGWVQSKYLQEQSQSVPSFDCHKAAGEVEHLICSDSDLSRLDQTMHAVFHEALHVAPQLDEAPEKAVKHLRAAQRGWIKGRNDCWQATHDKRGCIRFHYEHRISQLQAQWMLVKAGDPLLYHCENKAEFYLAPYETPSLPSAAVEYGDSREIFIATPTASGTKYLGEFGRYTWIKGNNALFVWDQDKPDALRCTLSSRQKP